MHAARSGDRNVVGGDRAIYDRGIGCLRRGDRWTSDRWASFRGCGTTSGGGGGGLQAYSRTLTIDHTKCGATDSTAFPVLFNTTDASFRSVANGGHVASGSGFDFRFYADAGLTTPLDYELERYNAATGEVIIWVKVPTVSHVAPDTVIYMAYGNASLSTDGSNAVNAFSNSFRAVLHLGNGTTLTGKDSLTGTDLMQPAGSPAAAAGQIDGAGSFLSASSQSLDINSGTTPPGYDPGGAFTHTCWVKATSFPNTYQCPMMQVNGVGSHKTMLVKSTGKLAAFVSYNVGSDVSYDGTGAITLVTGTWYHLALCYNSTVGLKTYVNGVPDVTVAPNIAAVSTPSLSIGHDGQTAGRFWNGLIDEVRIATVVRTVDWLLTEFNNQNSPGTFYTLGSEVIL